MRIRNIKNRPLKKGQIAYEYQARSPSNGKVEKIALRKGHPALHNRYFKDRVTKVKPYYSAVANGMFAYSPLSNPEHDHNLTNSELLANLFIQNPSIALTLGEEFPDNEATNGAIDGAMRYGDVLLMVSLAEASQTAHMFRSIYISLYRFVFSIYDAVKKLDPYEAYKIASDLWLQYRYGWKPLYLEIQSLKKLWHIGDDYNIRSSYGLWKSPKLDRKFSVDAVSSIDGALVQTSHTVTVKQVTYKNGFSYFNSLDSDNVDTMRLLGLDVESLLQTAHELIPFSFILDMFLNLGNSLKQLDFTSNVKPINGYKTTRYVVEVQTKTDFSTGVSSSGTIWKVAPKYVENYDYYRQVKKLLLDAHGEYGSRNNPFGDLPVPVVEPEWFHTVNVQDYELGALIHTRDGNGAVYRRGLWYREGTRHEVLLDPDVIVLFRNSSGIALKSLAWMVERRYTFIYGRRPQTRAYMVVQPYPPLLKKRFFPNTLDRKVFDQEGNDRVAHKLLSQLFVDGVYNRPTVGIQDYLHNQGVYLTKWRCNRNGIYSLKPHQFDSTVPRYMVPRFYNDADTVLKITFSLVDSFNGEFLTRDVKDDFEFSLVAETDLTDHQMIDLTIFSERLINALRK